MSNAAKSRLTGSRITTDTSAKAASPVATSPLGSGEDPAVLALPRRLLARWKARLAGNVWLPVAARSAGVVLTMGALAGVGAASTLEGNGVPLSSQASATGLESLAGVWLAQAASASPSPLGSTATPVPSAPAGDPGSARAPAPAAPHGEDKTASSSGDTKPGVTADGKVVLNTASATELTRLPRVGPKKAQAIVELRKRLGRFKKPTDLLRVKGIGTKTLQQMLPHLVVDLPDSS